MDDGLLSAGEAARRLGVSVRTLDRMMVPGHPVPLLPATRTPVGGRRRYDPEDVERIRREAGQRVVPPPGTPAAQH